MPTTYKAAPNVFAALSTTVALMNGAPVHSFSKLPVAKNDAALQPK